MVSSAHRLDKSAQYQKFALPGTIGCAGVASEEVAVYFPLYSVCSNNRAAHAGGHAGVVCARILL